MKLIHESDYTRIWERTDGILKIEVFTAYRAAFPSFDGHIHLTDLSL